MTNETETVYASILVDPTTGRRETQPVNPDGAILAELDWAEGVDNTPWKQTCQVAHAGDTVYYRYPAQK